MTTALKRLSRPHLTTAALPLLCGLTFASGWILAGVSHSDEDPGSRLPAKTEPRPPAPGKSAGGRIDIRAAAKEIAANSESSALWEVLTGERGSYGLSDEVFAELWRREGPRTLETAAARGDESKRRYLLRNFIKLWAADDLPAATQWFSSHLELLPHDQYSITGGVIVSASKCENEAQREATIATLQSLPSKILTDSASYLAFDREGLLDPSLLETATALGTRREFLSQNLSRACAFKTDISGPWQQVPKDEREAVLDQVLTEASKETDRPNAAASRELWKAAVLEAWDAPASSGSK